MIACVRCGSPVDQRAVFCGICGQSRVATPPLASQSSPAPPAAPATNNGMQPVIVILLGLIVVMAIAAVAFFIGRGTTEQSAPVAAVSGPAEPVAAPPTSVAPVPVVSADPAVSAQVAVPPRRQYQPILATCIVIDDSGTPLNIRTTPNGRIIGGLVYGLEVDVIGERRSPSGNLWSRISEDNAVNRSGWVLSALLDCRP